MLNKIRFVNVFEVKMKTRMEGNLYVCVFLDLYFFCCFSQMDDMVWVCDSGDLVSGR